MKNKSIGLILSHIFVRENEKFKFSIVQKIIDLYKKSNINFYYVLSGHGLEPSEELKKQFDYIIWSQKIDENQIGRGHPFFCIKAYEHMIEKGIEKTLKMRAYDYLDTNIIDTNYDNNKILISEQYSKKLQYIGDLFLFGDTKKIHNLWTSLNWDYSKNGLNNLYNNCKHLANNNNTEINEFINSNFEYIEPEILNWITFEDHDLDKNEKAQLWGKNKNYEYYKGI